MARGKTVLNLGWKAYEADKKNAEKKAAFSDAFDAMNAYRTSIEGDFALNLHREAYNEMVQLQWPHKVSVPKGKK